MNKNFKLLLVLLLVLVLPVGVEAGGSNDDKTDTNTSSIKDVCDNDVMNASQSVCEADSNCKWVWNNKDAGDGYCAMKPITMSICNTLQSSKSDCTAIPACRWIDDSGGNGGFCDLKTEYKSCSEMSETERNKTRYCVSRCKYKVEVFSNNIETKNNKTTCYFWITAGLTNSNLTINWIDGYSNKFGTLNKNQISFMCANKAVNFFNTNLDKPLENVTDDIAIYDFKTKWNKFYKSSAQCPKLGFAHSDNYFIYFLEEQPNPPWNMGGTQTTEPDPKDEEETGKSEVDVGNCDTLPIGIINYLVDALKLIRWICLVLVVIFGVLDFVKATAADDQDALKKAWQSFIKRLIVLIVLFLIPLLVEFVLEIAGLYKGCDWNIS